MHSETEEVRNKERRGEERKREDKRREERTQEVVIKVKKKGKWEGRIGSEEICMDEGGKEEHRRRKRSKEMRDGMEEKGTQ